MIDTDSPMGPAEFRRRALSRWDDEGGAMASEPHVSLAEVPELTNTELVQLRIRVIALENLLIAVLAEGSDRQAQTAREMAELISPQTGSSQHPLTLQAAKHMIDLVERAAHIQNQPPS